MAKQADIKLRAFIITQNSSITQESADILPELTDKLSATAAKDRMLKRSSEKEDKEHDLVSSAEFDNNTIFGVMLRVELDSTSPQVPNNLLEFNSFSLSDLKDEDKKNTIYKNHYYFCINNTHLVTTLSGNTTIIGYQTYINWLLNSATQQYEITPLCKSTPEVKLSDIKEIVFEDDSILLSHNRQSKTVAEDTSDKIYNIALDGIKHILSDTIDLDDEEIKRVVSARLLLKLKKPRGMSEEEYRKKFGAILKPVSDTDHLHYVSKQGQRLKADTVAVTKNITVETTGRGFLVEEQLRQSMIQFLNEQKKP